MGTFSLTQILLLFVSVPLFVAIDDLTTSTSHGSGVNNFWDLLERYLHLLLYFQLLGTFIMLVVGVGVHYHSNRTNQQLAELEKER